MNINYNYLFILLFLITLSIVIKQYDRFPYVKKGQDYDAFLRSLHNYYVTNIYYELFILVIYLLSYFTIFLLFRVKLLGNALSVMTISLFAFNINLLIKGVLFLLCIMFYINIINTLFYPTIIRLHYYFYQFEWYENIVANCSGNFRILSNMIFPIYSHIAQLLMSRESFSKFRKQERDVQHLYDDSPEGFQKLYNRQKNYEKLWIVVHNNKILYLVTKIIKYLVSLLETHLSRMLYSISYPILFLILIWEIYRGGVLYYIYYALFAYFIIIWVKKVRYFLSVRDPAEKSITDYFYTNEISYLKIRALLDDNNIEHVFHNIGEDTKRLLGYKDEMIKYILDNFTVYHVMYPVRKANEKYIRNNINRIHMMILVVIGIIYYYLNASKYSLMLCGTRIETYIILVTLLPLLYYVEKNILYDTEKPASEEVCVVWAENKYYKRLFYTIIILMTIPMLYILLKNKLTIFPNEVLLELEGYIKIVDNYTIKQKVKYLRDYLAFLKNVLELPEEYWASIMTKINDNIIIADNITLAEIREKVENIISIWLENYNAAGAYEENPLVKIFNKIKNVFKK